MKSARRLALLPLLAVLAAPASTQAGGGFEIDAAAISGGGGRSSGNGYSLIGTIGQRDVGLMGGNRLAVLGGLWAMVSTATLAPCAGDCGGDGQVFVNELLTMVRLSLTDSPPDDCRAGDADDDGRVSVAEVIAAVDRALTSCF
jgi:hypothetical protein